MLLIKSKVQPIDSLKTKPMQIALSKNKNVLLEVAASVTQTELKFSKSQMTFDLNSSTQERVKKLD